METKERQPTNGVKFISCHYRLKSGKYKNKSLLEISKIDEGFITWFTNQGYKITGMEAYNKKKFEDAIKSDVEWKKAIAVDYSFDLKVRYKEIEGGYYMIVCPLTGLLVIDKDYQKGKQRLKNEYNSILQAKNSIERN